jgi:hypothetical protein
MLLTTDEYVDRFNNGEFDRDMARTVASWWYSPGQGAMVAFVTADKILPSLYREVEMELDWARGNSETLSTDVADLTKLLEWIKEN